MKGCFLLQRNFAYIGHYLAVHLKKNYGIHDFCGYVYVRSSYEFLKRQTDIAYTSLLLDQEVHERFRHEKLDFAFLSTLERDYGIPNLWPYLTVDRVLMHGQLIREYPYDQPLYSHEDMLRILQVTAKAIINFLDTERPDFVFFSVIGGVGSKLLYHIAQKRGIPTYVVHPTSIRDTYTISRVYNGLTFANEAFERFKSDETPAELQQQAEKLLTEFRDKPRPHYELADPSKLPTNRTQQFRFLLPKNFVKVTRWIARYSYRHISNVNRHDYDYIGPWNYLKDSTKRKLRNLRGTADLYDQPDWGENFAFFPLHYEPEITLLLYAPYFTDQTHLIKYIAQSLPVGYKLYVKEHPAMVPYRTRKFYEQIKKIPNVKLLHPSISSFQILPHARLITTITSSVGWESCYLGKPVITFGDIFYNQLSFVRQCTNLRDLPDLVHKQLTSFAYNEQELLTFIAAIFSESATVNLQFLWEREKNLERKLEGVEPLAHLLARKIGLQKLHSKD